MSVFPDWKKHAVPQKHPRTGCIPTGYEMLLRAAHTEGIDFSSFQDEFDLSHSGKGHNDFETVANAVQKRYPHVSFSVKKFGSGKEKLDFVEKKLAREQPTLISLSLNPQGCQCHIVPVVDADDENLSLLWSVDSAGNMDIRKMKKSEFARVHDEWSGGDDVAFLES